MAEAVIETEGLQKDYGSVRALGPISVELPAGGAWGLLGPNGAGKTTLLRLLLGLTAPSQGSARVLGSDPTKDPLGIRERIGFVPEREAHVPGLTGVRYVTYAGRLSGLPATDAKQRAHEALNFVGLDEERYRDVADYSQGMKQRAKLAQAIVHDPDVLFLDEPTNGLDPEGREEMLDLVKELAHTHGITTILASHILPDVEHVCDGALVLENGEAVANDAMSQLQAVQEATYLLRIRGQPEPLSRELEERGASMETTPEGLHVIRVPAQAGTRSILEAAQAAQVQVRHLEPARASLEDALMAVLDEEAAR